MGATATARQEHRKVGARLSATATALGEAVDLVPLVFYMGYELAMQLAFFFFVCYKSITWVWLTIVNSIWVRM
jgi:hypothetical protein